MFERLFSFVRRQTKEEARLKRFIERKFAYSPKNIEVFREAVTHKSFIALSSENALANERLEFLGDAILDAVVAEFLYMKFPTEDEGYLTKIKSKIVSRKTLSEIGETLNLREVLYYHKGRSINLTSLEGNAFEAIIGAIYLDGGYSAVKKVIQQHFFAKKVDLNKLLSEEIDFKSKLFIWCQKRHIQLEFLVLTEQANRGERSYEVQVNINELPHGKGWGATKKEAEQNAAKETFVLLGELGV